MKKLPMQLRKWDFSWIFIVAITVFVVVACSKSIPKSSNLDAKSKTLLRICGNFLDEKTGTDELINITIPDQALSADLEADVNHLIRHTLRSSKISKDIKEITGAAAIEYFQLDGLNGQSIVILGQSVFFKDGQLWDEYSAHPYWKVVRRWIREKQIVFVSTRIPNEQVLPAIPNYDLNAF